jgi:hypothetical protein
MNREDIHELHCITPLANVPSILSHGILCHRRAARIRHESVAKQRVQDDRAKVRVPGGKPLHEYANLYFCARNPMLYLRKSMHQQLCVLRINPNVLDLPGVVVADQNAASSYCRFSAAPAGLAYVDHAKVFADYWTHPDDPIAEWRHKSMKCAEVLVPDFVDPKFITGAYVSDSGSSAVLAQQAPGLQVAINAHLFFW